ncbi:hypothetical protein EHS25_005557 [Saitozyma podzolica]|uniref:Uncharacterized protein n=1 Tax=Saitozyma podzolica TaxID=1890683 RepID=A0A427XXV8_9TREE|nr:hypothetical protein EHS25_005557 [Saitozyma podzolica]
MSRLSIDRIECVAKVERGQVGIWPAQGTFQSTVDCPYHRLNPTLGADAPCTSTPFLTCSRDINQFPNIHYRASSAHRQTTSSRPSPVRGHFCDLSSWIHSTSDSITVYGTGAIVGGLS